ncbi:MAG: hypothetical protein ACRD1H_13420 [Vicinamibacterales bacterium]
MRLAFVDAVRRTNNSGDDAVIASQCSRSGVIQIAFDAALDATAIDRL